MALKGVLTAVAALVGVVALLVVLAVSTGYVVVEDPAAAASEVVSGDVQPPEVNTDNWSIDEEESDLDQVVFRGDLLIDNTVNSIGGSVDVVEYETYVSARPDSGFEKIGEGTTEDLVVPPSERVTENVSFETEPTQFLDAAGSTSLDAVYTRETYMRVDGVAMLTFGPFNFQVEFSQVDRLS